MNTMVEKGACHLCSSLCPLLCRVLVQVTAQGCAALRVRELILVDVTCVNSVVSNILVVCGPVWSISLFILRNRKLHSLWNGRIVELESSAILPTVPTMALCNESSSMSKLFKKLAAPSKASRVWIKLGSRYLCGHGMHSLSRDLYFHPGAVQSCVVLSCADAVWCCAVLCGAVWCCRVAYVVLAHFCVVLCEKDVREKLEHPGVATEA
jgi:hypothetical protein